MTLQLLKDGAPRTRRASVLLRLGMGAPSQQPALEIWRGEVSLQQGQHLLLGTASLSILCFALAESKSALDPEMAHLLGALLDGRESGSHFRWQLAAVRPASRFEAGAR